MLKGIRRGSSEQDRLDFIDPLLLLYKGRGQHGTSPGANHERDDRPSGGDCRAAAERRPPERFYRTGESRHRC